MLSGKKKLWALPVSANCESQPDTRLTLLESRKVALPVIGIAELQDFLNCFYCCKEIKEVCGKNLGRTECSLRALAYRRVVMFYFVHFC